MKWISLSIKLGFILLNLNGCDDDPRDEAVLLPADGVYGLMGEIRPNASQVERDIFEQGFIVATRQFTIGEGLGPYFNVTSCGGCHEKPTFGGAAGHYRDFYIYGERITGGGFSPSGPRSGVLTTFNHLSLDEQGRGQVDKTDPEAEANLFTLRNPVPFFGIGLLAEIPEEEILSRADPDDADGDGISGRPNFDQGYVGRFGLKSQTVSIENFIRGPLFNHLGITSDPLSPERQAALPVPSVSIDREEGEASIGRWEQAVTEGEVILEQRTFHQAAAPSEPLSDLDSVPDPELSEDDLFALVSWAMLLAAPEADIPDLVAERGQGVFYSMGCASCHTPALRGPRGLIYAYSDLLLHDMGDELADGVVMGLASGSEFRTHPLWGISATGPYLHDGRAGSLSEAIELHGGEATQSRETYIAASLEDREALLAFLYSLGGSGQVSEGLLPPESPLSVGDGLAEPLDDLQGEDRERYLNGRAVYDRDWSIFKGLGPLFNGDSCRGCHFQPAIGGSGPTGVSAVRALDRERLIEIDHDGQVIRRFSAHSRPPSSSLDEEVSQYEVRQALPSFGLGILASIPEEAILANEDPEDEDADGITGIARRMDDGRISRFGWRAQLPSIREFIADAMGVELGVTIPETLQLKAATTSDDDEVSDPELSVTEFENLVFFLNQLAPPTPRVVEGRETEMERGRIIFNQLGCASCHIPTLHDAQRAAAYTDLLLHDVQSDDSGRLFRTPPLWGVGFTGTYWHDGRADRLWDAILLHRGEADRARGAAVELSEEDQASLIYFLETL